MGIRTIMVSILPFPADRSGVLNSLHVAEHFKAHLEAVMPQPDPDDAFVYMGLSPVSGDSARHELHARILAENAAAKEQTFRRFARLRRKVGIVHRRKPELSREASASIRAVTGEPTGVLPESAKAHDLIIFTEAYRQHHFAFENALEATLLRSGRPVLFLPKGTFRPSYNHSLIAWDGSTSCARAVSAWLNFGAGDRSATVAGYATTDFDKPDLERVSEHLAWHGVQATVERGRGDRGDVGKQLLAAARARGSELIVMGAYGHGRFREAIWGGTTRYVLNHTHIPVLLMH
jgi:nucleotide-binding universal stress UspA family protein